MRVFFTDMAGYTASAVAARVAHEGHEVVNGVHDGDALLRRLADVDRDPLDLLGQSLGAGHTPLLALHRHHDGRATGESGTDRAGLNRAQTIIPR